ncbi:MAG: DEAD/DEAH box helicase [Verrucomicrobia bacterium]|nr:DEAD/DEAH box helicase [Verrucomicrobiota bacterium]
MDILRTHSAIVQDYEAYIKSFLNIADEKILAKVEESLKSGKLWPSPLLQFNPSFEVAGDVAVLTQQQVVHPAFADIFRDAKTKQLFKLYRHQVEAIKLGASGKGFVVTSGTGSGKSLTYMGTIFDHLLKNPSSKGVTAVVVYPMNALINSQHAEFQRYKANYTASTGKEFPITFGQYTGQEKEEQRQAMRDNPPQILLTNYMMLELLLTRVRERGMRDGIYANLRFLVFDELHTYRGRQGADVAMLVRRIQAQCSHDLVCIGTSATMVSGGTLAEQQVQVASVATKLFGRAFAPSQVVNEVLTRSLDYSGSTPDGPALAAAISAPVELTASVSKLRSHPVATWLENTAAIETREGRLVRCRPLELVEIVHQLAADAGVSPEAARAHLEQLLQWISAANKALQDSGERYTLLPFKLHQFISQTGSVYTTLDQDGDGRFITLEPGLFRADDEQQKPIFPNVFSRASGHAFICVTRVGNKLEPREFQERESDDDADTQDGYLIVGEGIWDESDMELMPDAWVKANKENAYSARKDYKHLFPVKLHFDEFGNCSETIPKRWWGWFMRAPLLFDPTSGTFYDTKTKEGTKLTKLGSEGRSTSTTITTFSILNQLADAGFPRPDQKLLSFTDNRQDAALQAGHFNDFVQIIRLRAAIRKALDDAPGKSLAFSGLGEAIFKALNLAKVTEYANTSEENLPPATLRGFREKFQDFLLYQAIADLRRSWRIILPNLEQCALLRIDYRDLEENTGPDSNTFWSDVPVLSDLTPELRADFVRTVLDFCRLEFAIESDLLNESRLRQVEKEFRAMLRAPWTLDRDEKLREPQHIRLHTLRANTGLSAVSAGPASSLGKFIKLFVERQGIQVDLRKANYDAFITRLFSKLESAGYLASSKARSSDNLEVPVYRLVLHMLVWRAGDRETVRIDAVKQRSYKDRAKVRPNAFFQRLYLRDFSQTKRLQGEDHTGQLNTDTRIDREEKFRKGDISALFCSPTMELGIDISNLSVVHMRNAPPNPANYAQRSGRAGRSGQAALVFTYCSSYSPHDRHYFENKKDLVAGAVQAPRLDLCNRELLASHLNALLISQIGLPGLETENGGRPSLMRFVVDDGHKLDLAPSVRAGLELSPTTRSQVKDTFQRVVHDFADELRTNAASWFNDQWADQNLSKITDNLDRSLERWRHIYRSARAILTRATQRIEAGVLTPGSEEYRKFDRQQKQSSHQLGLLRNEGGGFAELSEFYPYRYLASEGFLPGYNFTRLPLRVFIPTPDGTAGEFISRPRAIALREFGPLNIIYHRGRKYRINQLVTQDAEGALKSAKISTKAGYFFPEDQKDKEICPMTGLNLSDNANRTVLQDLIEMSESRTEEVERISCAEEERVSRGFDVQVFFSVDGGHFDRVRRALVSTSENTLLNLRFIPAARLVHVNKNWRAQPNQDGFPLGLVSGDWRQSIPPPDEKRPEVFRLVKLFTTNLADALYIQPVQPLGLNADGVVTLQHALKRAIESVFQVEPAEIGVHSVGDPESPNILLYEASEGSLGILSQFVEDVSKFRAVVEKAIELCLYHEADYKAPASYRDLLSYYNQRDHKRINRFAIRDALEKLRVSSVTLSTNEKFASYDEHYQSLLRSIDPTSSTERKFLDHLYQHGLRLPDSAQRRVEGIFVQPDFYYESRIWVFCDGTPHDDPAVQAEDEAKRQAIIARGDEVWVYHYRDDLAAITSARPDIFRKVK